MISRYYIHKKKSVIILLLLVIIYGISYRFQKESDPDKLLEEITKKLKETKAELANLKSLKTEFNFVDNQYVGIRDFFQYNCQKQIRSVSLSDTQSKPFAFYLLFSKLIKELVEQRNL